MLKSYTRPYRLQIFIGSFAKFIEALLELYIPFLMADILNIGIVGKDSRYILYKGALIALLVIIGFASSTLCQYTASVISQRIATNVRYGLMEHISQLSYSDLDTMGTSALVNRLTVDLNNYQYMLVMSMRMAVRGPAIAVGAVIMSLLIDPRLALIFVILIPLLAVIITFFIKYTAPLFKSAQKKLDDFSLIIRETLSGIRVIRAFATAEREQQKANRSAQGAGDAYMRVESIFASMNPINSVLLNGAVVFILFLGAQKINSGRVQQGEVLALTIYANKVLYALIVIANLMVVVTRGATSGSRINEIFKTIPSMAFPATSKAPVPYKEYIQFTNVSFSYPTSGPVLSDISFSLGKGETMGIVGITGSGKTTLIQLLQRFYDCSDGSISISGVNVKAYSKEDIRGKIGLAPQESILFSGTIADNLRMSAPNASDNEIRAALGTAQCLEFVDDLPGGINATLHQGGSNLSGGQKQRLSIARALVARPELLVMDDCLSALDYKTDANLRRSLAIDLPDSTVIIISQRINSVLKADKIAVLDNGKLVGFDKHENLLNTSLLYSEIYASQNALGEDGFNE